MIIRKKTNYINKKNDMKRRLGSEELHKKKITQKSVKKNYIEKNYTEKRQYKKEIIYKNNYIEKEKILYRKKTISFPLIGQLVEY